MIFNFDTMPAWFQTAYLVGQVIITIIVVLIVIFGLIFGGKR